MKAEDRTRLVMNALGWQGGTVHELCKVIHCDVREFLYADAENVGVMNSSFSIGWFAAKTSPQYLKTKAIKEQAGNVQFWFGVASAQNLIELETA